MGCKKIYFIFILIFLLLSKFAAGEIIYDKNGIVITSIEYKVFKKNFENFDKTELSKNQTIKKIILMKNIIDIIKKNNPEYYQAIDQKLEEELGTNELNNIIDIDFKRFFKIKNDFINQYFMEEFSLNDLKNSFFILNEIKLPISNNKCFTILKVVDLKNNDYFYKNFYQNLKKNLSEFKVNINQQDYNVCISQKDLRYFEELIIRYISKKIESNFNNFIYRTKN